MNFKELQTEQKLRGGYYTPEDLADFLTRWVAGANPESILEGGSFAQSFTLPLISSLTDY